MNEFEKWWEENSKAPSMIYCTSEDKCRAAWQAATLAQKRKDIAVMEIIQEYIGFLETSENEAFSLTKAHGYTCPQNIIEKGIVLRNAIAKAIEEG
jgi:hypothetical protein